MKRGRKKGHKPLYTPQQTKHYKSMQMRYEKSLAINPDSVKEVDGKQTYIFLSERSPLGKWEVKKEPSNVGFNFQTSGFLGIIGQADTEYNFVPSKSTELDRPNTTFQGTITLKSGLTYPVTKILSGGIQTSVWVDPLLYPDVESIKYRFNWSLGLSPIGSVVISDAVGVAPYRAEVPDIGDIDDVASGSVEADYIGSASPGSLLITIQVSKAVKGFGAGNGGLIAASQEIEVLEVNGVPVESGGDGGYQCTCPDFSKKIEAFPSGYESETRTRNWESSEAGTDEYCKHILSVMRYRGEAIPNYLDLPE